MSNCFYKRNILLCVLIFISRLLSLFLVMPSNIKIWIFDWFTCAVDIVHQSRHRGSTAVTA